MSVSEHHMCGCCGVRPRDSASLFCHHCRTRPRTAEAMWSRVSADINAAHAALGSPTLDDLPEQVPRSKVLILMRMAAGYAYALGADDTAERFGERLAEVAR